MTTMRNIEENIRKVVRKSYENRTKSRQKINIYRFCFRAQKIIRKSSENHQKSMRKIIGKIRKVVRKSQRNAVPRHIKKRDKKKKRAS